MKDQFVIACIDRPEDAATVLHWARHFAERLNRKGLMVLHVARQKGDDRWLEALGVPFASLVGDWRTALDGLPTAFNGILAVTAFNPSAPRSSLAHPRTLLREFRGCKIAYLCIPSQNSEFKIQNSKFEIPTAHLYNNPQGEVPVHLPQADFRIECGKGTYIRSLARDLGLALGSGAFLSALRRERVGDYAVGSALQLEQVETHLNNLA